MASVCVCVTTMRPMTKRKRLGNLGNGNVQND